MGRKANGRGTPALFFSVFFLAAAMAAGCADYSAEPEAADGSGKGTFAKELADSNREANKISEEVSDKLDPDAAPVEEIAPPGKTLASYSPQQREALQARGMYLTTTAGACGSCHSAVSSGIFGPGAVLSGGRLMTDQFGQVRAANITPDRISGIGDWTVEDIAAAIRSSISKGNKPISLDLHAGYRWLAESDTEAIAVYLLSLQPVRNDVVRRDLGYFDRNKYGLMYRFSPVSGYVPRAKSGPNAANGRYLATNLSRCMVCHNRSGGLPEESAAISGNTDDSSALSMGGISAGGAKLLSVLGTILFAPTLDNTEIDPESYRLLSPAARQNIDLVVQAKANDPDLDIRARAIQDGIFPVGGPDIHAGPGARLEYWKTEDIVNYLRTGKNPEGQSRDGRFCPWPNFSDMSGDDQTAIAVYLKRLD